VTVGPRLVAAVVRDGSAEPGPSRDRNRALDGLRGVAAAIVVVHHLLLVLPGVAALLDPAAPATGPDAGSWAWWLYRTPLRLVWAGPEAVLLFFVLSGFVLTLPLGADRTRRGWSVYYRRRFLRLYLPVWGSLVLALALALLVPRDVGAASWWLSIHRPPSPAALAHDSVLVFGTSNLNSPLWSLRWEIWFSLLLPAAWWVLRRTGGRRWPVTVLGLAVVSASTGLPFVADVVPPGGLLSGLLTYLPVFGIGVVLARSTDELHRLSDRVLATARPGAAFGAVAVLAVVAALSPTAAPGPVPAVVPFLLRTASLLGVTALVVLASGWPAAARRLTAAPVQWLGSRSFSLYLVHEPLVVAAALLLGGPAALQWGTAAVPVLVVVLVATEVFHRLVERPAHRLSRRVGSGPDLRSRPALRPQSAR